MKSFLRFIKTTVTGGILFLLPVVLLIMLFAKAYNILNILSAPISEKLPKIILGFDGGNILVIALLIVISFVSGLLFRSKLVKGWVKKLEDNLLINLPGYALIKSITASAIGKQIETDMLPILIQEEDAWNLAFLVEKGEKFSTVFIPDAPRHDAGEVKIILSTRIKKLDISLNKFILAIKNYGKGANNWIT